MRGVRLVLAALAVSACSGDQPEADGARTVVFSDVESCAAWTRSDRCGWVLCDLVPEGETFESVCGPYFQEGVTAPGLDDEAIDRIAGLLVDTCATVEVGQGDVVVARLPDDTWISFAGPRSWRTATAALVGVDCEA